jgi:hypothetical protein
MKSTAERLSEAYCRPKTKDEWVTIFSAKKMDRESSLADRYIEMKYDLAYVVSDGVLLPLNGGMMWAHKRQMSMRTEIPVQHFLDLMNDSIVSWRALLDGFDIHSATHEIKNGFTEFKFNINEIYVFVKFPYDNSKPSVSLFKSDIKIPMEGCKTYTELLILIRLIG